MSAVVESQPSTIVSVRFGKSEKLYDYYADFPVEVGQKAFIESRDGDGLIKVEIVAIKHHSERAAKSLVRIADEEQEDKAS